METPHVLAIPYPSQGHVIPLLELAQCLVRHGFKVTFVNTEFNHKRVMNALSDNDILTNIVNLVSIPDGLEPWEDRNDLRKLTESTSEVMPGKLEELIEKINGSDNKKKITCVIADGSLGWALEVAVKMGIRRAAFWPAAAAQWALQLSIPELIADGIIESYGMPVINRMIQLSPSMPSMNTESFPWICFHDENTNKSIFDCLTRNNKAVKFADRLVCNSSYELESAAFALFPNFLPIGSLSASNRLGKSSGHFWPEDSTCLDWLDQQPGQSVIYVAFGSITVFDQIQFQELAMGLELTNRPFLWVVRPDITKEASDAYLTEIKERVATRGRMVCWAPQDKVLGHPSVACFLSHCGWNSTIEGISNGIPFLCWPYFADQFFNQSYICDVWKVGLGFNKDEGGIIRHEEIKDKVEQLLADEALKSRALHLKEVIAKTVEEGGTSSNNLNNFIKWMKE
ncbi:UDP-glycosyltransferase 83A1-like isoform X2 [Rhododendron vialii]|uniref:UDP-glycosyltransferase 83A1-like isoform X2 n=1 Tax=Rhododendron vialii TaxID=182163 RepID=UPI0026600525|nr:UDP-glycosyltransferase 83A1-like isoform X2 [Rhododendron vialii]